jgi:hypothetical protein
MTETQQNVRVGPWDDADVTRVVRALRRSGPLPMSELHLTADLAGWTRQRVEHAVVTAWSSNLIFVDTRDLLVAL